MFVTVSTKGVLTANNITNYSLYVSPSIAAASSRLQELELLPNMCHYYNIMTLLDLSCVYIVWILDNLF